LARLYAIFSTTVYPLHYLRQTTTAIVLWQREEWVRFSYSNEDTKDEERRKGWVGDRRTKCGAKHQARTLSPGPHHNEESTELLDPSVYMEYQLVLIVEREKLLKADRNDRECYGTVGVVRNSNSIENSMNTTT
jgi:hypothetical protein